MSNKYFWTGLFLALLFGACTQKQTGDVDKIRAYYLEHRPGSEKEFEQFRKIVIVRENGGSCMNCNDMFARHMADSIDNPQILFIVSAMGNKMDISAYIDRERKNVIWDNLLKFDKLNISETCAVIDLSQNNRKTEYSVDNIGVLIQGR